MRFKIKNMKRFGVILAAVVSAAVLLMAGNASAASWPQKGKILTFYIASGAGGGGDMAGRAMAQFLEQELGVKIVVINKPGGASVVGFTEFLAKSGTDGYAMIMASTPYSHPPMIDPDRGATYSMKDLVLASSFAFSPCAVAVKPNGPYKSLKDVVEAARARPNQVKGTAAGPLTQNDLSMVLLNRAAGIQLGRMYFDQQGEQRAALLGGHADAEFNNDFELIPGERSKEIKTIAIFDRQESANLPGVPTAVSLGYPVYMSSMYGLAFKAGTPKDIVDTVATALERASKKKDMQEMFKKLSLEVRVMKGKELYNVWNYNEGIVRDVIAELKKAGAGKQK